MRSWRCVLVVNKMISYYSAKYGGSPGPGEEVPQVDKLAVPLILDVDNAPAVLATPNGLTIDDDGALRTDNCERNHALWEE